MHDQEEARTLNRIDDIRRQALDALANEDLVANPRRAILMDAVDRLMNIPAHKRLPVFDELFGMLHKLHKAKQLALIDALVYGYTRWSTRQRKAIVAEIRMHCHHNKAFLERPNMREVLALHNSIYEPEQTLWFWSGVWCK